MVITSKNIDQIDLNKPRNKCRKWKLIANYKDGSQYRRKVRRVTCSISEAKLALDEFIDELENGAIHKNLTFKEYGEKWLSYREKTKNYSPNTINTNKHNLIRLNGIFGDYYLTQLTTEIIKNGLIDVPLINNPEGKQASNTYKRKLHATMKNILETAILDGYLNENPMKNIPLPKKDTKSRTAITKKQFDYLITLLSKRPLNGFNVAIQLICYLGLRRGEVVALTWDDYNEQEKTITVNQALKEKSHTIGKPKSESSIRTIPLSNNVTRLLKNWKNIYSQHELDTNFICCNNQGKLMHPQNLYRWWKKNDSFGKQQWS